MHTIAIIGSGFSGTLLAAHLLRSPAPAPSRILLLERTGRFGRGIAYGATSRVHVLNVPAGRMSAFSDDPDHFLRWLRRTDPLASGGDFVPRLLYGEYLEEILNDAARGARSTLERLHAHAIDIVPGSPPAITLTDGRRLTAARIVLAVGNFPPADPPGADPSLSTSPRYARDPWSPAALDGIAPHDPVLIIGTGLTMLDTALELDARGHRGPIHALSRRGLLPQPHRSPAHHHHPQPPSDLASWERTARGLLRAVRAEVRRGAAAGVDWREVITSLRADTPALWQSLGEREQRRWLAHIRPFWETHRHRAAPAPAAAIESMVRDGRLTVHAARIVSFDSGADALRVTVLPRGRGAAITLAVSRVINCTGPETDLSRTTDPLLGALRTRGLIAPDPLGLGLLSTPCGAAIDARGNPSDSLYLLGPLRRPQLWETTAVPELRLQTASLAAHLAPESSRPAPAKPGPAAIGDSFIPAPRA